MALISVVILAGLALLLWNPWGGKPYEGKLTFYCAAGMQTPIKEIISDFEQKYPKIEISLDPGPSGAKLAQIEAAQGRGDLYLSADAFHMDKAKKAGLVSEVFPVAKIHPVLVVNAETQKQLKAENKAVTGLKDLLRDELKVVLASESAAAGRLSREILKSNGLLEKVKNKPTGKFVEAGTVNHTATTISTTKNSLGFIWDITAIQHKDKVTVIDVPEIQSVSEQVLLGVLTKSERPTQAIRFARFVTARDKGQVNFKHHHFNVIPDADKWEETPRLVLASGAMLKPGIEETVERFAKREGVNIDRAYAGCGILVTDMKILKAKAEKGRKLDKFPDAYFSCDVSFMKDVQQWFEASKIVSKNKMVILVQKGNPKNVKSLEDLKRKDLKVGLGHPKNSALGSLTDKLLKHLSYHSEVYAEDRKTPIVHKSEGHDLVNNVHLGALDAAVVYQSNAMSAPKFKEKMDIVKIKIPEAFATQPFAVAKDSEHKYLMRRLLEAIMEAQTLNHMKELGFEIPGDNKE